MRLSSTSFPIFKFTQGSKFSHILFVFVFGLCLILKTYLPFFFPYQKNMSILHMYAHLVFLNIEKYNCIMLYNFLLTNKKEEAKITKLGKEES